ncbi:hypothetical protein [Corallococcus carmarthensis]|uniref:Uncharacterized protein n=1 Tax=Corallococcus carmarthensis TaxID=2316728 RepID=A0A3A8KI22_9BACT|nr:hypothetical protein [Corallococcus carmarthensis]NOK16493.1 hypothetical protein [Corallococcus carmarthensis]RKH07206.1 hypothetical protein D7X32_02320 [Corallococcus carmarthensis]
MLRGTRWRSGLVVMAAVACGASLLLGLWPAGEPQTSPAPAVATPRVIAPATLETMEARASALALERKKKMPEPEVPQEVGGFPREEVLAVLNAYQDMIAVQGLYNQGVTRKKLIERILASPHGAEIAEKTLAEPAFAQEAFGEFQAESRYLAVNVVTAAARKGNDRYLTRSADAVAQDLARSHARDGKLSEGRSTDLNDLVHAYIDVKGLEAFSSGNPQALRAVGLSSALPEDVRRIYDEVVFMRLKAEFGRERASEMTATLMRP